MYRLQNISLQPSIGSEQARELWYRGDAELFQREGNETVIRKAGFLDLFTYFNSLSVEKWLRYTYAKRFSLNLDIQGHFEISMFGYYVEHNVVKKELLGRHRFHIEEREIVTIPFPSSMAQSMVVGFQITTYSKVLFYDGYYAAEVDEIHIPSISMVTTTYKKEHFVKRNMDILTKEIFEDEEYAEHFDWWIIDNGRTLPEIKENRIRICHNKNTGGAGGFARGMIEALTAETRFSHILLMDDDVFINPESLKRLFHLLAIIRPEYANHFVAGAMLNMDAPNIQHENTGYISEKGYAMPLHSGKDLNIWDQIVWNEVDEEKERRYAAWWFCCIPTTVARLDNLPLPIFVRGDDMEYSFRNHAKFITMNGISIWHQGFVGKCNAAMDFYQSKRNELVIFATNPDMNTDATFALIEEMFWQELYKFNYIGAEYLLDAVEDFLKGPEWFFKQDLFAILQEKQKGDYVFEDIPEEIDRQIPWDDLAAYEEVGPIQKLIYDYTFNGQARIPQFFLGTKIGIIPLQGGYYPAKQMMTSVNYAIDFQNGKCVVFRKDVGRFRELNANFNILKQRYKNEIEDVEQAYSNMKKMYVHREA